MKSENGCHIFFQMQKFIKYFGINIEIHYINDRDEISEIWKAINLINSKLEVTAISLTSPTRSPGELRSIENLSSENDLLKAKQSSVKWKRSSKEQRKKT